MPVFLEGVGILSLLLLAGGLVLLTVELFHPGFGAAGGLGILLLAVDIVITAKTLQQGLILTAAAAVIVLLFLLLGARLMSRGKLPGKLILHEENGEAEGFRSSRDPEELVGKQGIAVTVLRPAGIMELDRRRWDVVTRGEFLPEGSSVVVEEVSGGRIVVRQAAPAEAAAT